MRSSPYFKTISRILIFIVVGFLIYLWCSGCASFGGGNLQELETFPTAPEVPPKVKLTFALPSYKHDFMGIDRRLAMRHALNGFEETNYFSEVGPKVDNPDTQITVRYQRKKVESISHTRFLLCTVTLLLYCPHQDKHHFIVDAIVTHLKTGQVKAYHLKDTMSIHFNIFYILVPWRHPVFVDGDIIENMFKHLAVKMYEDGLLATAPNGT